MSTAPDPRPFHRRATEQAARLIATVRPDQLTLPTACTEFDVRGLLSHVVGGTLRIAEIGEGSDTPRAATAEGVPDDGWPAAYGEARARVLKAWESDERMASPVRVPWGDLTGREALGGFVMELVAHTWDLSEALGHPTELDPEQAEFALVAAHRGLPASRPRDAGVPFDPIVEAPAGAGPYERLAAWLGRVPLRA